MHGFQCISSRHDDYLNETKTNKQTKINNMQGLCLALNDMTSQTERAFAFSRNGVVKDSIAIESVGVNGPHHVMKNESTIHMKHTDLDNICMVLKVMIH